MTCFRGRWASCVAVGLYGGSLVAQQPPSAQPPPMQTAPQVTAPSKVFTGKVADLRGHAFNLDGLTVSLSLSTSFGSINSIDLRVENPSIGFLEFHPEDLVVLDTNNSQLRIGIRAAGKDPNLYEIPLFHLAPAASTNRSYIPYGPLGYLKPPFKIYFGEKLIAEITK